MTITEMLNCPVCKKEIEVIKGEDGRDLPEFSLRWHMLQFHNRLEITRSYVDYYLKSINYPISEKGTLD